MSSVFSAGFSVDACPSSFTRLLLSTAWLHSSKFHPTIVLFALLFFAVFSTPYHLFSNPSQLFSTPPPPQFFSTYPILPPLESVLYSAVTYTLSGHINVHHNWPTCYTPYPQLATPHQAYSKSLPFATLKNIHCIATKSNHHYH